jgi:hypothetical protein
MPGANTIHDPEFIALVRLVFDQGCAALLPERDTQIWKTLKLRLGYAGQHVLSARGLERLRPPH